MEEGRGRYLILGQITMENLIPWLIVMGIPIVLIAIIIFQDNIK